MQKPDLPSRPKSVIPIMKLPVGHPACADSSASCEPCVETRSHYVEIRSPGPAGRELQEVARLVSENPGVQGRVRKSQDQNYRDPGPGGVHDFPEPGCRQDCRGKMQSGDSSQGC